MKAMAVTAFGGPEVLKGVEMDRPAAGRGDILIKVLAAGVNPVDCKTRGAPRWGNTEPPIVLGFDVCGTVAAVGDGVAGFSVGDRVLASPALSRPGAYAEFVAVDHRVVVKIPESVDEFEAAALPLVGLTAWESLFLHGGISEGSKATVLIHAGAGGVGHIAIQLAKAAGCRVLTTAGREESKALCREVGADVVIDYKTENVAERVAEETGGKGCGVVLDTVGGEVFAASLGCVAAYGRVVTIVPGVPGDGINALFAKNASIHFEFMGAPQLLGIDAEIERQGETLRELARRVVAGALKPHVSKRWDFDGIAEAHRQQETGRTIGKQVVRIS